MGKIAGSKVKLYIKDVTGVVLGGQRGATLNRSAETIDVTSKDSDDWAESIPGKKSWSIDADGVYVISDAAYATLETNFLAGTTIVAYIQFPSGKKYEGTCMITDFPIEMPYDDLATYSVSLTGTGILANPA